MPWLVPALREHVRCRHCGAEHVRGHRCAPVTIPISRCAMCAKSSQSIAPRTRFCCPCSQDGNAERARRLRPGRLAQGPRGLQTLATAAVSAEDGVQGTSAIRTPFGVSSYTPDASKMRRAHARLLRALSGTLGAIRRLEGPHGCWIERVSHRYTAFVMIGAPSGGPCPHRYTDRHTPGHASNTDRYTTGIRASRPGGAVGGP